MGTSTATRAAAAEKRKKALQLRRAGATYDVVAEQAGYKSKGAAHDAVAMALRDIPKEAADELRALELDRLDAILRPLMVRLANGDMGVVRDLLAVHDRRVRLVGLLQVEPDSPHAELKAALGGFLMDAIAKDRQQEQLEALGPDAGLATGIESD